MTSTPFDPERFAHRLAPAGALLTVGGGCLGGAPGLAVAALGIVLLLAASFSRRDGLLLLGPLAGAELARSARSRRTWLWRALYAAFAGAVFLGNVSAYAPGLLSFEPQYYPPGQIAFINLQVTTWFAVALAVYSIWLTFQLMPSVVAEEREAKRWDILLTTDLRPREILLGKAVARLVLVVDPILTVMPILALTPLLGGVSPVLIFVYFGMLLSVIVSLTAVAVFNSVFSTTTTDAATRTVGAVALYYGGLLPLYIFCVFPWIWYFPTSAGLTSTVNFGDLVEGVLVGHPVQVAVSVSQGVRGGRGLLEDMLWQQLPAFVAFHVGVALLYGLMACRRLRFARPWSRQSRRALRQVRRAEASPRATPDDPLLDRAPASRPPIGDDPVAWWMRYGRLGAGQLARLNPTPRRRLKTFGALVLLMLAVYPLDLIWPWGPGVWSEVAKLIIPTVLWLTTWPLFLGPMYRAAGCVAEERNADTLLNLRLTALTERDILYQKGLGCLLQQLPLYLFMITFGLAATVTGFVSLLTVPVLAVVTPPGMALLTAVGLWFSVTATTPTRAKRLMSLVVFGGGYLASIIVGWGLGALWRSLYYGSGAKMPDAFVTLLAIPLPPAATWFPSYLKLFMTERVRNSPADWPVGALSMVGAVLFQSVAAYVIFRWAVRRFERERGS